MTRWLAVLALLVGLGAAPPLFARQDDARLDGLFQSLHDTADAAEARRLEVEIWRAWTVSGSATIDLLMRRGAQAMQQGRHGIALEVFDRVVDLAPDFAEGWNKRATIHYLMGNYDASVADIQRTLGLEPRHFGALSGLGLIYGAREDDRRALKAFSKALEVNPHLRLARRAVIHLKKKLKDQGI